MAHYSAALCHLANISYRLGTLEPFNKVSQSLGDNKQVVETFNNLGENLKVVGLKLDDTSYMVGKKLTFDPATEQFTSEGSDVANPLLTRNYRAPFVVPAAV